MVANADTASTRQGDCLMPRPIPSVSESTLAADLLMKDIASGDEPRVRSAAGRFLRIEPFRSPGIDGLLKGRDTIQRKHALRIVAREQGFAGWKNLKDAADVFWLPAKAGGYAQNWCKTHPEARAWLEQRGGYLLTAQGKWFIAERGFIEFLGLDPDDPRWATIGWDTAEPADTTVRDELVASLVRRRSA